MENKTQNTEELLSKVKEYVELSHKGNTSFLTKDGRRFIELESEIEEYIELPEMDVCAFLEDKFKL
jgi:hypothetical protein